MNASDRGHVYTTVNGRQYRMVKKFDWALPPNGGPIDCKWLVFCQNRERPILFSIGCEILFGGEIYVNREDKIPEGLATLTIQWLLEEAGEPPVDCLYCGVFTREGLQHRLGQPKDQQFGEDVCRTLRDVVEQVRSNLSEAKKRGRQIGFHSLRSEFWTHKSEIAQFV